MLPRMGSNYDCNVYREKSCKTIENLAGFHKNVLIEITGKLIRLTGFNEICCIPKNQLFINYFQLRF